MMLSGCHNGQSDKEPDFSVRLDSVLEARYPNPQQPGAAVLVAKGDSIIYERYFGVADMTTGERVDSNTLFNIASISKQFTVVGLMQTGIDLERPASDFFRYPQPFWTQITLADLAGHTSGIPDSRDRSNRERCVYATDETSEAYFPTVDSLKFEPGAAYDYLNPSFILLARVIEQASGQEFTQYQQEHIFDPLGMTHTVYFSPDSMPAHTAHGYVPEGQGWKEYDYGEETFFATRPDGGIYSTARDMLRWETGLENGAILPDSLLRRAYAPRVNVAESPWCDYQRRPHTWYGLGWFVDTTPGEPIKAYHTGDNGGFQAYVAKYPDEGIKIIVLENRPDQDRWTLARTIDSLVQSLILPQARNRR